MEINREFISKAREIIIDKIKDEKVADIFEKCMNNTLDTTVKFHEDETVFIITGDIPAMWLRDSVCQIRPYLLFARDNKDIANMIKGLIRKHYKLIKMPLMKVQMEWGIKKILLKCYQRYGSVNMS